MNRFRGWVTSFVVGFALFIAGAAVANETDLGSSEDVASASEETVQEEEQVVEADESAVIEEEPVVVEEKSGNVSEEEIIILEEEAATVGEDSSPEDEIVIEYVPSSDNGTRDHSNPVFCWNIGKGHERDLDCFCVAGEVSDMNEVDCLIASGIVPASDRETYMRNLGLIEPSRVISIPNTADHNNPVFCWDIGKSNELDGDCFCVKGEVSDLREVDCLIESGLVEPDSRQRYISFFQATR